MTTLSEQMEVRPAVAGDTPFALVALIAFLTLVDLFAAQAILPSLVAAFGVTPAEMGFAVNASTFGMALAGLAVALFGGRKDRRKGICVSLALLSIPTALLSVTHDLTLFALLRVVQGLFMSMAFTLTAAYLAEHLPPARAAGALAAYVTGNVASNLFGRILSASVADGFGLPANFLLFAALNLAGAALVWSTLKSDDRMMAARPAPRTQGWLVHLRDPAMLATFAIGFLILFVFIGTYTYVNFRLVAAPISLSPMQLGLVYLVFLPSLLTTPFGGSLARRLGPARGIALTLLLAIAGLLALLSTQLSLVLAGLATVAVGTFLAQAVAAGHAGGLARHDKAAASGMYLGAYYSGGLAGSLVLGQVFERAGWTSVVLVLAAALGLAILLSLRIRVRPYA